MRKSTLVTMTILLGGLMALMLAFQFALKPLEQDAAFARDLTAELQHRGDLEKGSALKILAARKAGEETLAAAGLGVVLSLSPHADVRAREGGLQALTRRVVESLLERYRARKVEWIELRLHLHGDTRPPFRTLIKVEDGVAGPALPQLPAPF